MESPRTALESARMERDSHARECTAWDYESNGGCAECEEHRRAVKRALAAYDKAFGRREDRP